MIERFGRYELILELGRGGMGVVYEAFDTLRDRTVALKVLSPHFAEDETYQARFRREAKLAGKLNDPHIIPIHEFGEIDGRLYIDMRLVEGVDASNLLQERQRVPPDLSTHIISQVASALDAAHRTGLVHRDVKPSNILLTGIREGNGAKAFAYLVDFGIARPQEGDTGAPLSTNGAVGTTAYLAPERIQGQRGDGRSDVYALACVLYEFLVGSPPFSGEQFAVLYAHVNTTPPALPDLGLAPEHGRALNEVVARGLAKKPEDRFATAEMLATAASTVVRAAASSLSAFPLPAWHGHTEVVPNLQFDAPFAGRPAEVVRGIHPSGPFDAAGAPINAVSAPPGESDIVPPARPVPPRLRGRSLLLAIGAAAVLTGGAAVAIAKFGGGEDTSSGQNVTGQTGVTASVSTPPTSSSVSVAAGVGMTTSCSGRRCTFTVSGGASTIMWDFGDKRTSTGATVVHTFAGPGDYPVVARSGGDKIAAVIVRVTRLVRTATLTGDSSGPLALLLRISGDPRCLSGPFDLQMTTGGRFVTTKVHGTAHAGRALVIAPEYGQFRIRVREKVAVDARYCPSVVTDHVLIQPAYSSPTLPPVYSTTPPRTPTYSTTPPRTPTYSTTPPLPGG